MYDKLILHIVVACTLLCSTLAFFLILFIIRYRNKVQQHLIEKQKLIFELEKKELSMGYNERELILEELSREVHDNIGQVAHLVRMNLHSIEQHSTNAEQLEQIKYASELMGHIINGTRYLAHSLNSSFIKDRGLYRMLEYDAERINASRQINCFVDINGDQDDRSITVETQLLVYRIAQEAIHNVLQHANAVNLEIELTYNKDRFAMIIRDDGIGFDEMAVKEKGTMGIGNMYQRAKLLNGFLHINSSYGKGCMVDLSFTHEHTVRRF